MAQVRAGSGGGSGKKSLRGPWSDDDLNKAREVLSRHTRVKAAAAELGIGEDALSNVFRRRGETATQHLKAPDWSVVIPEGHRIKGNSTLTDENGETLKRWVKTERDSDDPPAFEPVPEGHLVQGVSTFLDGQGKVRGQWVKARPEEQERWDQFWAACARSVEQYKGLAGTTPPPKATNDDLLTLYPLGDPHIGMLAWHRETGKDFDLHIAERDLLSVVDMLVDRAPSSKIGVLANVGDYYHADSPSQLTPTGGNKLDVDGRWTKVAEIGFTIERRLIDRLLTKHEQVIVVNVPGNHDPVSARMLNFVVKALYEQEPRVSVVDNANPIMYLQHGKTLLGFAHGDQMKIDQMPRVMAAEQPQAWGNSVYRMWITGHVHHLVRKEFEGCVVESFRTLAPADAWHHGMGYRAGQSLCCITFDQEWGEISRSTVDLRLGRSGGDSRREVRRTRS